MARIIDRAFHLQRIDTRRKEWMSNIVDHCSTFKP
jgi:hypothetical protein